MEAGNQSSVLVTGGRGFIGRAAVKLLQRTGYRTISLDQSSAADGDEVRCDITDSGRLKALFEQQSIGGIVHLAAVLPTSAQRTPGLATQVNIRGSLNLLEMARQFAVPRFVFGSSLSIYGSYPWDQVVSETDRAAPQDLYGAAKLYVEQLGEAYRRTHGLEFVSLRIGRVVGPGARSATSAWRSEIFEHIGSDSSAEIAIPYAASERILLVHVEDVAKMLVVLMEAARPARGVYNAVCESVVVGELKREVQRLRKNIRVKLGSEEAAGNPRRLDSSRFAEEFGYRAVPIFEQLAEAASGALRPGN